MQNQATCSPSLPDLRLGRVCARCAAADTPLHCTRTALCFSRPIWRSTAAPLHCTGPLGRAHSPLGRNRLVSLFVSKAKLAHFSQLATHQAPSWAATQATQATQATPIVTCLHTWPCVSVCLCMGRVGPVGRPSQRASVHLTGAMWPSNCGDKLGPVV